MSRSTTEPTKSCALSKLTSAWASAQSDESSLCALWIYQLPVVTAPNLLQADLSLRCWFCHALAHFMGLDSVEVPTPGFQVGHMAWKLLPFHIG